MQPIVIAAEAAEEHSILLPAAPDLLWGAVSFVILYLLFARFVLPAMSKTLAAREDKITGGMARAKAMQAEAEAAKEAYAAQLAKANQEAAAIRTNARSDGERIIAEARAQAQTAVEALNERANALILAERDAAAGALRRDVGDLAVDLAGKIVGESLSDDARAKAVIDRFIADLEAQAAAEEPAGAPQP